MDIDVVSIDVSLGVGVSGATVFVAGDWFVGKEGSDDPAEVGSTEECCGFSEVGVSGESEVHS